jgi:hypothetical protein
VKLAADIKAHPKRHTHALRSAITASPYICAPLNFDADRLLWRDPIGFEVVEIFARVHEYVNEEFKIGNLGMFLSNRTARFVNC